jgi:hypothetical protein
MPPEEAAQAAAELEEDEAEEIGEQQAPLKGQRDAAASVAAAEATLAAEEEEDMSEHLLDVPHLAPPGRPLLIPSTLVSRFMVASAEQWDRGHETMGHLLAVQKVRLPVVLLPPGSHCCRMVASSSLTSFCSHNAAGLTASSSSRTRPMFCWYSSVTSMGRSCSDGSMHASLPASLSTVAC